MNLITFDPKIEKIPDILSTKCMCVKFPLSDKVKFIIKELERNLDLLIFKYGNTRGIGLSANQIGENLSIAIVNFREEKIVLINPKLLNFSKSETLSRIGCLSFFKYRGMVRHPKEIKITFEDIEGNKHLRKFSGDEALVLLHEIDHISGISLVERSESGVFIPWDITYPIGSNVPFKNSGIIFNLKRYLYNHGICIDFNPQTDIQYYSQFFREKRDDLSLYISNSVKKRIEMINLIKKYTPLKGKILEAGCGTSSHSVYLSKEGYQVTAIDIENDMLGLAKKFNETLSGNVIYTLGDIFHLPFKSNTYNTIFSHGVLEHFSNQEIVSIINESLRVANTVIISVPTIFDISNNLMGDEILRSVFRWKSILRKTNGYLKETHGSFPFHPRLRRLKKLTGKILDFIAPVAIFVIVKE